MAYLSLKLFVREGAADEKSAIYTLQSRSHAGGVVEVALHQRDARQSCEVLHAWIIHTANHGANRNAAGRGQLVHNMTTRVGGGHRNKDDARGARGRAAGRPHRTG